MKLCYAATSGVLTTLLLQQCLVLSPTKSVLAITKEDCETQYLPNLLACLDDPDRRDEDCAPLPLLDEAFPNNPINEIGYWIQNLRDSPQTQVFAVGDDGYNHMLVIDVPSYNDKKDPRRLSAKSMSRKKKRTMAWDNPNRKRQQWTMMNKPTRTATGDKLRHRKPRDRASNKSNKPLRYPKDITVAILDFPEPLIQRDQQRNAIGFHGLSALQEIMQDVLGRPFDDIGKIEMIYSHSHLDHVAGANVTYKILTEQMGFPKEDISIIATKGTADYFEELKRTKRWNGRAITPTVTYDKEMVHTIGQNSHILMSPVEGAHTHDGSDVIFYMDREGDQPPILMMIDIVTPGWAPLFRFGHATDLLGFVQVYDTLLGYDLGDDGHFVGGHVSRIGKRNDIVLNKAFTNTVLSSVQQSLVTVNGAAILSSTGVMDPSSPNYFNRYYSNSLISAELERTCARIALEAAGCDLAAADVVLPTLCDRARFFLRIES